MSFLFPMVWWLGGLALPVAVFYLLKSRQRCRNVSSLLFWDVLKPKMENSPLWRKFRRWLSLLLQLLILLFLIASVARPAFEWEKKAPRRVVAVLDPSASMQVTSPLPGRWPSAVAGLQSAIDRMRVQDEMAILIAENPPQILSGWTSGKRGLKAALARAVPQSTGTDPGPALALASDLIALRENAEIQIYSDSVWPEGSWNKPVPNARFEGVGSDSVSNVGLTLFAVRRSPVAPGDWQLDAEIFSTKAFSGKLELLRDGRPMDLIPVECAAGGHWRKSWRGNSEVGARFEAKLNAPSDDVLPLDNSASCELQPLAKLNVLIAGKPDSYLEAVLDSIPMVNCRIEKDFPVRAAEGTDLIIAIGDALPTGAAGTTPLLLINPTKSGFWGSMDGKLSDVPVTDVSKSSPFVRRAGLGNVVVNRAVRWRPPSEAEILASSTDVPLIFGHWDREPRWLVVGFDPPDSDLPLRTAFPIFMGNLLQSLRDRSDLKNAAALLPGLVESRMVPLVKPSQDLPSKSQAVAAFPGWWLVLLVGLLVLVAEWYLFNRRITD